MSIRFLALSWFCIAALTGSAPSPQKSAGPKPLTVITTILPYKTFIEAVGGDRVHVTVLIPPQANPHTYELTPGQLKLISTADIYIKVGTPIEFELTWADKLFSLNKRLVAGNSAAGITLLDGEEHTHTDRVSPGNDTQGTDPHIWLSPHNAIQIVRNIQDILSKNDPDHADYYQERAEAYRTELQKLDRTIQTRLTPYAGRSFLTYHPSWGYFAHRYRLTQLSIENEGKEASPRSIARTIDAARDQNIHTIFIAPQINSNSAEAIARQIHGRTITIDHLSADYAKTLMSLTEDLVRDYE